MHVSVAVPKLFGWKNSSTSQFFLQHFWLKKPGEEKNMGKSASPSAAAAAEKSGKTVIFNGLAGLFEAWDGVPSLRERCRTCGALLIECPAPGGKETKPGGALAKTVTNVKYNYHALAPVMQKMKAVRFAVPCLETLTSELVKLMKAHGYNPDSKEISDQAWSIRYMYGVLKGLQYKDAPPKAT